MLSQACTVAGAVAGGTLASKYNHSDEVQRSGDTMSVAGGAVAGGVLGAVIDCLLIKYQLDHMEFHLGSSASTL